MEKRQEVIAALRDWCIRVMKGDSYSGEVEALPQMLGIYLDETKGAAAATTAVKTEVRDADGSIRVSPW
ncbi:hypothetical protein LSG31_00710 [Fodinisporobacter ferrooxydans]|uniref:Uncharacterized protein n=1 Tax=Fodinisporobacter ferrooxydans TaxID=2901836 RepID=A0ABY4CKN0_9BACL|nr:hypothetical protein LSG31_00710 [Alicyclobacillaceae bacterium MYW30-H2]